MFVVARCCSACYHNSRFVVRIASRQALWLGAYVWAFGDASGCGDALEFWIDAPAGKAVGKP